MEKEAAEAVSRAAIGAPPSRGGSQAERVSTASILGVRKRSIIGMQEGPELPKILEAPRTDSKQLSRSVLIDK
jgi:hypothetical protein